VKYLFLANEGMPETTELRVEPFNASQEQNDYEVSWKEGFCFSFPPNRIRKDIFNGIFSPFFFFF